MREVVFDTETTGINPFQGHRLVEIGCVELVDKELTGRFFHHYLNPEREVPEAAFKIHGLSTDFLKDQPKFKEIADGFLGFIGDSGLIAHNASFDIGFINSELGRIERSPLSLDRMIDTLFMARKRHPNVPNNLDDLCIRYNIDKSKRTFHGALLDAQLLAEIYKWLVDGKMPDLPKPEEVKPTDAPRLSLVSRRSRIDYERI